VKYVVGFGPLDGCSRLDLSRDIMGNDSKVCSSVAYILFVLLVVNFSSEQQLNMLLHSISNFELAALMFVMAG